MRSSLIVILNVVLMGLVAHAGNALLEPSTVNVPITQVYTPSGFDSNDKIQIMIEGEFANNCFRVGENQVRVDAKKKQVIIQHTAYEYTGRCSEKMKLNYNQVVEIGFLNPGTYELIDALSNTRVGELAVGLALSTEADNYDYAVVKDAYINMIEPGQQHVILNLTLPGTCWTLAHKEFIQENDRVITILPIIEYNSHANCVDLDFQYVATLKMPEVKPGRYLLQVRSRSGGSIFKLVDL